MLAPSILLRGRAAFATLVVLTLGLGPAVAREGDKAPPEHIFADQIGVEVVSIDVVVDDKRGHAIRRLTRDDFELRIDGKLVEIANFYAVQPAAAEPAAPAPSPEPAKAPAPPTADAPRREPVHAVVFLDNFYLAPTGRERLLNQLPDFLEHLLAAGSRVMIVAHDRQTAILGSFTTEMDDVRKALAAAAELPASGLQHHRQRRSTLGLILDVVNGCRAPCSDCFDEMINLATTYRSWVENERYGTLDALGQIVDALSLIEGRKVLFYASDGMEQQGAVDVFHFLGELCPQNATASELVQAQLRQEGLTDFHRLTAAANASRVTFYPLEAAGLRGLSSASVEMRVTPSPANDQIRVANLQNTLSFFADATGGRAILNTNQFTPALAKLREEVGSYYSLGYTPSHPGAGRTHRVAVKVKGPHSEVRFRRSYLHKEAEQLKVEKTLGAFFLGVEDNPLEAEVRTGELRSGKEGRFVVPIEVSVPWDRLTLLPYEGARHGRLTLRIAAPDAQGEKTSLRKMGIPLRAPLEEAATAGQRYRVGVHLTLPAGEHGVWVAIWDEVAATASYFSLRIRATDGRT